MKKLADSRFFCDPSWGGCGCDNARLQVYYVVRVSSEDKVTGAGDVGYMDSGI